MRLVETFGVCTPRCTSAVVDRASGVLTAPLGPSIVQWDLASLTRLRAVLAHRDVIVALVRVRLSFWPDPVYLTCSFGGHVRLWDHHLSPLSGELDLAVRSDVLSHFGDRFVLTTEEDHKPAGIVILEARRGSDTWPLELVFIDRVRRPISFACFAGDCCDPVLLEQADDLVTVSRLAAAPAAHPGNLVPETTLTLPTTLRGTVDVVVVSDELGLIAVGFQGRRVTLLDSRTLEVRTSFLCTGRGVFKTLVMHKEQGTIACPTDAGAVLLYDIELLLALGPSQVWSDSDGLQPRASFSVSSGVIHLFEWLDDHHERACVVNDYELSVVHTSSSLSPCPSTVSFHAVTCCGVDVAHDTTGALIAAGDFSGRLFLWRVPGPLPLAQAHIQNCSVRSVAFISNEPNFVLVGDTEGALFEWRVGDEPRKVAQVDATATCIASVGQLWAVATTGGHVYVFERREGIMRLMFCFLAHERADEEAERDMRFGSLHRYAEVWSTCFAPQNDANVVQNSVESTQIGAKMGEMRLLTGSEDQTARIFRIETAAGDALLERTLYGHTAAVTSVQWKHTAARGHLIVTASDDCSVRVYDGQSYDVVSVLSTAAAGLGWHTITYCVLDAEAEIEGEPLIVCGTSNGHLAVWDVAGKGVEMGAPRVFKPHVGSVEGVAIMAEKGWIATCSSDCTVHLFSTRQPRL